MRRNHVLAATPVLATAVAATLASIAHAQALRFDLNSDNLMEAPNPDAGYSQTQGLNDDNTVNGMPTPPFDPWFINGGAASSGGDPRLTAFVFVDSNLTTPFTPHYPGTRVQINAAAGDVLDSVRRFSLPGQTASYFYNNLYRDAMFNTNTSAPYNPDSAQAGMHTAADNAAPNGPMNINISGLANNALYSVTLYTYDKWMDLDTAGVGQSVGVSRFRFTDVTNGANSNTGISAMYGRNTAPGGLTNETWSVTMLLRSTGAGTIILNEEALFEFGGSGNTLRSAVLNGVEVNALPTQWTGTGGSNYSEAGNWTAGSPNGATQGAFNNQIAYFGTSGNHAVTMNAPATLSQMVFDDGFSYSVGGSSTITLSGGGISVLNGSHTISAPVTATGMFLNLTVVPASSTLDITGLVTVNDTTLTVPNPKLLRGVINKEGAGLVLMNKVKSSVVTIGAGTLGLHANGASANVSNIGTLIIATNAQNAPVATLDLNDNDLIVGPRDASGTPQPGQPKATIQGLVAFSRNGGAWDRPGIRTSAATPGGVTTLGVLSGAEYHALNGVNAQFDGQNVADTDTLIKYTYNGDGDFSGRIDGADYARIDGAFNSQAATQTDIGSFANGDSDYSGRIDGADYALIDGAFNAQGSTILRMLGYLDGSDRDPRTMNTAALQLVMQHVDQFGDAYVAAALSSVPEPAFAGLASIAALGLKRRRRSN